MLGFAISGLVLTATLRAAAARRAEALALFGAGFALAVLGVSAVFCRVPAGSQWAPSSGAFLLAFVRLLPVALLFALPFLFAGLILGLLLASDDLPVRRIYFADLAGSAAGALVVAPAIRFVGVERSLGLAAGALALGTVLLAGARGRWARIGAAAGIGAAALVVAAPGRLFRMTYVEGSWLDAAQDAASGFVLETMDWDPVARIEVSRIPPLSPGAVPWPYLVGDDPALLSRMDRVLTQNNTALTYATTWDGRGGSLAGIRRALDAGACTHHDPQFPGLSMPWRPIRIGRRHWPV